MAKNKIYQSPVFGELEFVVGDLWKKMIEIPWFGTYCKIPINVEIDAEGEIENHQNVAFQFLDENQEHVLGQVEVSLLEYYQSIYPTYKDRFGARIPDIKDTMNLARVLSPEAIHFPYGHAKPTFAFLFKCLWDPEHGVAVVLREGQLEEIGTQDIVL